MTSGCVVRVLFIRSVLGVNIGHIICGCVVIIVVVVVVMIVI